MKNQNHPIKIKKTFFPIPEAFHSIIAFAGKQMNVKLILSLGIVFGVIGIFTLGLHSQEKINPQSIQSQELPKWKKLSTQEMKIRLKVYAYAKVRMSMKKKMVYSNDREIFYTPCPEIFPKIPGDLPCNFLEWDISGKNSLEPTKSSNEYREGGIINVLVSNNHSKLIGGSSILIPGSSRIENNNQTGKTKINEKLKEKKNSNDNAKLNDSDRTKDNQPKKEISDVKPDDIQIFYKPNHKISHYRYGNQAILFSWKKESGVDTLKSILVLELDSKLWAKSAQEMDFSK